MKDVNATYKKNHDVNDINFEVFVIIGPICDR